MPTTLAGHCPALVTPSAGPSPVHGKRKLIHVSLRTQRPLLPNPIEVRGGNFLEVLSMRHGYAAAMTTNERLVFGKRVEQPAAALLFEYCPS